MQLNINLVLHIFHLMDLSYIISVKAILGMTKSKVDLHKIYTSQKV